MTPPRPAELPELPALPLCYSGAPVSVTWAEDGETSSREVYTAEQMHKYALAYGLACIESAQAPKAGAVAWQARFRHSSRSNWGDWEECSETYYAAIKRENPVMWESRALYPEPPTHPEVRALVDAAKRLLRSIDTMVGDREGDNPLTDTGCIVCTLGTVSDRFNTGLCGYHATQTALSDLEKAE